MTGPGAQAAAAAQPQAGPPTPYARWVRGEALEVIDASAPLDLARVALRAWPRRGGSGAFLRGAELPSAADCYLCEIAPGGSLAPQRQLFEEIVLVLAGRGSTTFRGDRGEARSLEWKAGTLFALPLNATYRHFNGSGRERARFLAVTTAPAIIDAFDDLAFVFDSRRDFGERVLVTHADGAPRATRLDGACGLDALDCPLARLAQCGAGGHLFTNLGTRSLWALISQLPPGAYGKAHAFGAGAYTVVLAGAGCTLLWPGAGERAALSWSQGALLAAPGGVRRQHCNPGRSPARFLTLLPEAALERRADGTPSAWIDAAGGGACFESADEAPEIRAAFARALAERGLEARMGEARAVGAGGD